MNFHPQPKSSLGRRLSRLAALLLLAAAAECLARAAAPGASPRPLPPRLLLATELGATIRTPLGQPAPVHRLRLNPELAASAPGWLRPGQTLRLDLLEHQDITVAVETVEPTATGGLVVHGRATSDEASTVVLTLEGASLTGFIHLTGLGQFRIAPVATGDLIEVRKIPPRPPGFCGTGLFAMAETPASDFSRASVGLHSGDLPPADTLPEPTVVDVMFLYTPQTVIGEGNEEGIHRRVLESVEETNYRLTNSLINVRINPVFIGLIQYPESGDMTLDLPRLANGNGGLQRVPQMRNDYKADLVVLLTELENQGIGGYAWDLTPPRGNPSTGFAVVRREYCGRDRYTMPHELGHLLGCAHDREHAGQIAGSAFYAARKPYIFGHRFEVEGVTYVDVMSYEPGIYVPYYGNPHLKLDGVPLGVAADQPQPSDGARTINETAPYVARYRTALSRIEFAQARVVSSEQAGTAIVHLVRTGDLNTSTRVNVVFDPTSPAQADVDYTQPASTLVAFATNQATAELVIPLLPDDLVEGEESLRLSLAQVLGAHGIGAQGACEVVILDADTPAHYSQVEFPEGPAAVMESAGEARIKVRSSTQTGGNPDESLVLPYRTADGTALAGQDYQAVSGTLTNLSGTTEWEIVVPLLAQPTPGPDRVFSLVVGTRTNSVRILDEQRVGVLRGNPGRDLAADGVLNARVRSDGKLLVCGNFSRLGGEDRTGIALLNADGTVDDSFRPPEILLGHRRMERIGNPSSNAAIAAVRVQADGKLLLAGTFSRVNGQPRTTLVRLLPEGPVDGDFGRDLRFDGAVNDIAVQPDGRLLVGGAFEHINGERRPFIARLLADGTVDESFRPDGGPTSDWTVLILSLALQSDGKILMGGYFERVDGRPMLNLARLHSDGTFDRSFTLRSGASGPVSRIRLQPDGKIVVGGVFNTVGGRSSRKLARLNADGSNDPTFLPPHPDADVKNITCLPDGRLLVSGLFTRIGGLDRRFLALLNPDGTVDPNFDLGVGTDRFLGGEVFLGGEATPILADGSLYLSGPFQRFNGLPAPNLVRLSLGDLAPELVGARLASGELSATVHGFPGGRYPLESSPDLEQWEPAGEVRLDGYDHTADFTAPATGGARFFRLQPPAP